jgi:hypothetical protein
MQRDTHFVDIRDTTSRVIVLLMVVYVAATALLNFAFGLPTVRETLGAVQRATDGLVQGTLIGSPLIFGCVGVVVFGVGRLRCSDVGWRLAKLRPALLVTLAFWGAMQLGLALWVALSGGQPEWNHAWHQRGIGWFCGQLLGQLLGNALLEEMVFRGFFLPQFYLKASAHFRPAGALLLALLGSQVFFALTHIPNRLFVNILPAEKLLGDQLELILQGLTYCAVYVVTRNVFICVGLHSLFNQPARLLAVPFSPEVKLVWYALVVILLVLWSLTRSFRARGRPPIGGAVHPGRTSGSSQ